MKTVALILLLVLSSTVSAKEADRWLNPDFKLAESESSISVAINRIVTANGFTDVTVISYMLLDQKTVLAEIDVFPNRKNGLFLIDLVKKSLDGIGFGTGSIVNKANDLSGHPFGIREYKADAPGYNQIGYEALSIVQKPTGIYEVRSVVLAYYAIDYESEENLCSYFTTSNFVNINAELKVEYQGNIGDNIFVDVKRMACSDLTKKSLLVKFIPQKNGFISDNSPPNSIR